MRLFKKVICLLFAFSMMILTASCGTGNNDTSAPANSKLAENKFADYTFYYPDDWTLDHDTSFISIIGGGNSLIPEDKSVSVMVNDLTQPKTTPSEFWVQSQSYLSVTFSDLNELSVEELKVGGADACKVVYTAKITDKVYKFGQTFVIRSGAVYIITYTATEADFDEASNAYNMVLETFYFKTLLD